MNNDYVGKKNEEIIKILRKKYNDFIKKYDLYLLMFIGMYDIYINEKNQKLKNSHLDYATFAFKSSIFLRILLQDKSLNKEKSLKFLKKWDSEIITYISDDEVELTSNDELKNYAKDNYDLDTWLKYASNELSLINSEEKFVLTEEIWRDMIIDVENAYNAYVESSESLDLLGSYRKTAKDNSIAALNTSFYAFWLPLVAIIIFGIKFVVELFGDAGIIMNGGWLSFFFFVILLIWVMIGSNGMYCTCSNCHKWNSLQLVSDSVIDSEKYWERKHYMEKNYNNPVHVMVEKSVHEERYVCKHCGNKEIKYRTTKKEL